MEIKQQPNRWSCLPTAFAMACDIPLESLLKVIGHDGSEVISPDYPEPFKRRAFHIQELVHAVYNWDYLVTPFEKEPKLLKPDGTTFDIPVVGFHSRLKEMNGVLIGLGSAGLPHAVAWCKDDQKVYDPNFSIYDLDKFQVNTFWGINPIWRNDLWS